MSSNLAAATRDAVDARPFLRAALRAGVLNYAAAARYLDVAGDPDAVATALRRYADDLPDYRAEDRTAPVTMDSGYGRVENGEDPLLVINGTAYAAGAGSLTAVLAQGDVDPRALGAALARLGTSEVAVDAAGVAGGALVVLVDRRDGPDAVRLVEDALDAVPT